jgi:hypothetical protein
MKPEIYMIKESGNGFNGHYLVIVITGLFVSGCVGVYGSKGQSREEFEHYVEDVFRLQNQMTSEAMMLLDSNTVKNSAPLLLADQQMQQACDALNEYAARDIDGLSTGIFLRHRVEQSALKCERAAQKLKSLLGWL